MSTSEEVRVTQTAEAGTSVLGATSNCAPLYPNNNAIDYVPINRLIC